MNKEKIFEAFGELLYAIIRSGGKISTTEIEKLKDHLKGYTWGNDVFWSFHYEYSINRAYEEAYERAFDTFYNYGPIEEYESFFSLVDQLTARQDREFISETGEKMAKRFKNKLIRHFADNEKILFENFEQELD